MAISNKLTTIAENVQKVYEAGKSDGYSDGFETGSEEGYNKGKTDGYAEGQENGYNEGKTAEQNAFWDTYQDNGNRTNYDHAFAGEGWTDELYDPKYPINAESYIRLFAYNDKITDTKVPIVLGRYNSNQSDLAFGKCTSLKTIPLLTIGRNTEFIGTFEGCEALETIGWHGELWHDIYLDACPALNDETLRSLVHIAKDFIHDEDESVQELAYNYGIYFENYIAGYIWEIEMDERSPEYQGMTLGDVLIDKGWTC